ncbi:MAG: hypothetical protein WAU01_15790 [Saprospiraceae bacterium]
MNEDKDVVFSIPDTVDIWKKMQGKGLKKLLIILDQKSQNEPNLAILSKMMSAIKYDLDEDVHLLFLDSKSTISLGASAISYHDLIVFGIEPPQLGIHVEYEVGKILNFEHSRVLFCEHFEIVIPDHQKKNHLWKNLQNMFLNT